MIKSSQFTQQMIDLQKVSFLSFCNAATTLQKQASSAMDLVMNQAPWIPSEGRQVIADWLDTCQQEGDRFKTYVEKSFVNLGMYFSPEAVAKTTKTAKPSAAKAKKPPTAEPKKATVVPTKKASKEFKTKAAPIESKPVAKAPTTEPAKTATPAVTKKATPAQNPPIKIISEKKADIPEQ